jgi:prepilin-type N-terminal cleavage/methylation domain-containing protein
MLLRQANPGSADRYYTVQHMNPALGRAPFEGPRRAVFRRGFTLVEVMVATVLLSMIILGILEVLIGSYRVAAKARYRDHARYVIKSFADQFLTQDAFDGNGNLLPLFTPTVDSMGNATPLGTGMTWTNTDGSAGYSSTTPINDSSNVPVVGLNFYVLLGDNSGAPMTATVQRSVQYIYPQVNGGQTLISQNSPAGYMLEATFTISYQFLGQTINPPLSISAVRAVP